MLKVVGTGAAQDEVDGRFLLDEQAEGEGRVRRDHAMPSAREPISTIHGRESLSLPGHLAACYGRGGESVTKA